LKWAAILLCGALCVGAHRNAVAQASDGVMSEAEIESLRETAASPVERIAVYERMLNEREKSIDTLLAKPRRPGFGDDMHDAMEEFSSIADELNDNLDEYDASHRDVRKALPKLIASTERWATALRAAAEEDKYRVARKIALDTLADTHDLAVKMLDEQEKYFKEHPEAAKAEKDRKSGNPPQ
jgi:chromosome segregation ATPase